MANKHKKNKSPTNLISDQECLNYMRLFYVVDHIGKTLTRVMFQLVEDEDAYTFITVLGESTGVVFIRAIWPCLIKI